ncbi:MAG TPA: class I SAM-dependent methyltransferase [Nannocystaceae bacterium]|nr:class I SAM-dependent methyltransferase [Nannocystaceae bacterium]
MAGQDSQKIALTAHYTAHVWKRLALPHAELYATATGATLYWGFFALGEWTTRVLPDVPSMRTYLAYRHLLIDAIVEELAPDRIVELGAGLSRRATTWVLDGGIDGVEIDLPEMIAAKRAAIDRAPAEIRERLTARLRLVADDVLDPGFAGRLRALVAGARRPVVVAEGLASYFDGAGRRRLFGAVGEAIAGTAGAFVCDLHTRVNQARVGRSAALLRLAIGALTRRRRALDPYEDEHEVTAALRDAGFSSITIATPDAHVTRRPALRRLHSPAIVIIARAPVEE